jgi:hypothetical protein
MKVVEAKVSNFKSIRSTNDEASFPVSAVCYFRLDFENFQTNGPSTTLEPTGGTCQDTFIVTLVRIIARVSL